MYWIPTNLLEKKVIDDKIPYDKWLKAGTIRLYKDKKIDIAKGLLNDGRINYMTKADYRNGSEIDIIVKKSIMSMVVNTDLKNISDRQKKM